MKTKAEAKESARYCAACAAMLPGICACVALLLAGGAEGFGAMFARVFGYGCAAFLALCAWKM